MEIQPQAIAINNGVRLFTCKTNDLDLDNVKYTISFNSDKTRAWYFFNSKDLFFKWERAYKGKPMEISIADRVYKPTEVKEKN